LRETTPKKLSARWKTISPEDRQPYADLEAADRARFQAETEAADAEKLAEQEARRLNLEIQAGEAASSRGARQEQQALREDKEQRRRELKERREAEMDEDEIEEKRALKAAKKKEIDERQRKRAEEEALVQARHTKLTKEEAKKASNRLDYLFKQSSIFAKLKMGGGKATDADAPPPASPDHRQRGGAAAKQVGEEVDTDDDDDDKHHFLTKQPDCIKFGQMKPYQLEGLNWMIHLAEKGLNGILADEMVRTTMFPPYLETSLASFVKKSNSSFHFLRGLEKRCNPSRFLDIYMNFKEFRVPT